MVTTLVIIVAVLLYAPAVWCDSTAPAPRVPSNVTLDAEGYFQAKWPECVGKKDRKKLVEAGLDLGAATLGEPIMFWRLEANMEDLFLASDDLDPRGYAAHGYRFAVLIGDSCVGRVNSFLFRVDTMRRYPLRTEYRSCRSARCVCRYLDIRERIDTSRLTMVIVESNWSVVILLVDNEGDAWVEDSDGSLVSADSALAAFRKKPEPWKRPRPKTDMSGIDAVTDTIAIFADRSRNRPPPPPERIEEVYGARAIEILNGATSGEALITLPSMSSNHAVTFDRTIWDYPVLRDGVPLTAEDIAELRALVLDVGRYENVKYACTFEPDHAFIVDSEPDDLENMFCTGCLYVGMRCGDASLGTGTVAQSSRRLFHDFARSFWKDDTGLLLTITGGEEPPRRSWRNLKLFRSRGLRSFTASLENVSDRPIRVPTTGLRGNSHSLLKCYTEDGTYIPCLCLVSGLFAGSWADQIVLPPGLVMNYAVEFLPERESGRYHYKLEFYGAKSERWPDMWHGQLESNLLPVLRD